MPFWAPADEVQYPAEALALAGSLFPDKPRDNTFFTEASRKIFAHLLRYRPTPKELTEWMRNMDELDKRLAGTELEVMIPKSAGGQRAAVQGTFNQAAAAFQLLPTEQEANGRWSAAAWAKERRGWIFIPSSPTLRDSLRPLLSMWLDSLILRLMESTGTEVQRVWLILDELSGLQRLPQLPTGITESRKSNICLVIGFQGRSQLETLYGHQAEAMLSQPITKIFLRTSEPHAAEWVSRSIGEVEVMRVEETHSQTVPAFLGSRGKSTRTQRHTETCSSRASALMFSQPRSCSTANSRNSFVYRLFATCSFLSCKVCHCLSLSERTVDLNASRSPSEAFTVQIVR